MEFDGTSFWQSPAQLFSPLFSHFRGEWRRKSCLFSDDDAHSYGPAFDDSLVDIIIITSFEQTIPVGTGSSLRFRNQQSQTKTVL
jgi:hypothetical protein